MRILQIIETGGPGGAETIFAGLADSLVKRGHTVTCMTGEGSWLPHEMTRRALPASLIENRGALDLALLSRMRQTLRQQRIELVHAHLFDGALYAAIAARLEGVPCVATLHGQVDVARHGLKAWVKQRVFAHAITCAVTVSASLQQDLRGALRLPDAKLRVIPNGIERQFRARVDDASDALTAPRLVAVGNIRQPKDYPTLIEALGIIRATFPDVHLDIAGEPDRDGLFVALKAHVAARQLESHVTFHGFLADPAPLLARADCYVLSSSREGFSLTTIEAMLAGVPVVATRSGGPQEILRDGETGLLTPVGDPVALAAAVLRMLQDRTLAMQCRLSAQTDAASRYAMSGMVTAYEQLYGELLANG